MPLYFKSFGNRVDLVRPRLIQVTLTSTDDVPCTLGNARRLPCGTVVTSDWTLAQREHLLSLRTQVQEHTTRNLDH